MPELYQFNQAEIIAFFLVLLRLSTFFVTWPIFSAANVPGSVKILFSLTVAIAVFPTIGFEQVRADFESTNLAWLCVREVFIGVSLGFITKMFFFIFSISGQIISVSMGLSGVQLFNPTIGEKSTPLDQFQVLIASLIFLALNGHQMLIAAIVKSFDILPLSNNLIAVAEFATLGEFTQNIIIMGVKFSAPVLVAVLIMNLVMGIIGRAVPQINVLITSLPVNILAGFAVLIFSLPIFIVEVESIVELSTTGLLQFLKSY